jgi:PAS domain S-box-containing protein
MSARYSLVAPAPDGFEYHDFLSRAELRGGPFALFAADLLSVRIILQGLEDKLTGVVITWEMQFAWEPLGRTLFHLGVPPGLRAHLDDILPAYLDLIAALRAELDVDRALRLEMGRSREDQRRLAADHERSRKALLSDISERRQVEAALRESEATFKKLFSDSSDAILLINSAGVFVECNQAALDLLRMTREQFLLLPPARISPEFQPDGRRSAESAPEMIALAYSKGLHRFDWTCVNAEGGEFIVEVSLMPIVINGQTMLHTTWRDITRRKQMEEALRESEESYRTLFYSSPDPVWIIEKQRFVECNQAAVDMLGYPDKDSLRNTHPSDLSPEFQPDGEPSFSKAERMMRIAREEGIYRFEWVHRRKDQSDFFAEVTLSALTLQGRHVLYCTWRDITERKKVEAALRDRESRYRSLHESMSDAFAQIDMTGAIVEVNKAFESMTGYSQEELMHLTYRDLTPECWHAGEAGILEEQVIVRGYSEIYEKEYRCKDGGIIPVELRTYLLTDDRGRPVGIWSIVRNISQRKAVMQALQDMDRIKSEFISTAAHELRTPLATMLGYTELLRTPEDFGGFSKEQCDEFLDEIYDKGETLSRIIDEMLDISRIESGCPIALDLKPHGPQAWLGKVLRRFELQGARHAFTLEFAGRQPEALTCDLNRMTQVMENLISNAVKYSPCGGRITVSGEIVGADYVVTVTDQGIGMTPEQVTKIFDKFYRADASNTAVGGLGLGMSISRQIVENHGGSIWVASEPGVGTKVSFSLPLNSR